jgi:hypothetical protein
MTSRARHVLAIATAGIGIAACEMFRGASTGPEDVVVANPAEAVAAARAIIEEQRKDPAKYPPLVWPGMLPAPLRIQGLKYALVHADHVDLVLARNPDWDIGGRIWAREHRPHNDTPTAYPDIHFFQHTNDLPESPDNIP